MADPLSVAASVIALVQLGQTAYQLLAQLYDESPSKAFRELSSEIRGFYGVLCLLKNVLENIRSSAVNANEGYPCNVFII